MSNKRAGRRSSGYEVSICCNILILGVFCIMNTKFIRVYINILDIWLKVIHVWFEVLRALCPAILKLQCDLSADIGGSMNTLF